MIETINYRLPDPNSVQLETLLELDFYSEGPVEGVDGSLFFTDLAGKCIWKYKNNTATVWAKGLRPNGQAILKDGSHLICDSEAGWVAHYDRKGKIIAKLAFGIIEGIPIQCPSDIVANQHGFYFTDSIRHHGTVFYVGFDGTQKVVAKNIDYPNGIEISADDKYVFVAESYTNKILRITLEESGKMKGEIQIFSSLPNHPSNKKTGSLPDGLAIDAVGRLWVAHYGMQAVQVVSKTGELLATYDTGIPLTSNLCFRGPDVIITGGFKEPGPGRLSKLTVFEIESKK